MPVQYSFDVSDLNKELEDTFEPGEELEEEDFEELKVNPPKTPSFPFFVFTIALIKDFVDLPTLGILGIFTNIFAWIVIRIYIFRKVNFVKRWMYRRYIFTFILEFIPFINMIPQNTIFVLRAYAKEKKQINAVLEKLENLIIRFQKGETIEVGARGVSLRVSKSET